MSLEKIGLLFLLNYFNQLGEVKNHMMLAVREVLLAINSSLEIVSKSSPTALLGSRADVLAPFLKQAQGIINYTIERVSPSDALDPKTQLVEGMHLKEHIVDSIISAIDDEIESTNGTSDEKVKLKIDALQTVKNVLMNQLNKPIDVDAPTIKTTSRKTGSKVA